MIIRREEEADWFLVHALNTECFETPAEALLVDALREQIRPYVAMVAEEEGLIVGHVMFSPALLENHRDRKIMALAPLAVEAEYRRRGIAAELVRHGLHACKELGYGAVVVVGDPKYYPRFGFLPSPIFQLKCEFEIPEEAFLVIELQAEYLIGCSGTIKYPPAFSLV